MKNRSNNPIVEIGLLVLLAFLWGGSFTLIKIAIETVPPATVVLGRLIFGAGLLLLLLRMRRMILPTSASLWGAFTIQGLLQSALPFTLISWGEQHIDSSLAGLLNSTPPLFAVLMTVFVLGERKHSVRQSVGVLIGFLGVLATLGPEILSGSTESALGQLAILGASVSYAIAPIYARRFSGLPVLTTAACSMTMAMLIMLPLSLLIDRPWTLAPAPEALWSIAALGVLSTALAMVLYFRLVRTLGAVGVTSGSYLRAGCSVLLGVVFLGEAVTPGMIGGLVLILLSVGIVTGPAKRPVGERKTRIS